MIVNSITIRRAVADVFDYASHFERHPEWQEDLKTAEFTGPPSVGATGTETRRIGPRTHTYEWRISEFERPRRLAFETLSGLIRPVGRMTFTPVDDGTRLDFEMELRPLGPTKLVAPLIARQVRRSNDAHLAKFKELLEGGAAADVGW
jgi:uncharacterized membrane protein